MSIKIRRLQLNVQTEAGLHGCDLKFGDGLVVLRAENSMGKSTCVQSIIYALGLERMLGPSTELALPPVVRDELESEGRKLKVLESNVLLEIENSQGRSATVARNIVGGDGDRKLVKTWAGARLSDPGAAGPQKDFFVHDGGSATREAGFHSWLAEFVGWKLPILPKYNGGEAPLYLECIFPLFIVEQKRGWSGIQAVMPTFLGIRDMAKRAVEFVLNLDAARMENQRQRVSAEEARLRARWNVLASEVALIAGGVNGRAAGFPSDPTAIWPTVPPVELQVFENKAWVASETLSQDLKQKLDILVSTPLKTVGDVAPELSTRLEVSRTELAEAETRAASIFENIAAEKSQVQAVRTRVSTLREDLQHNQDAAKLKRLGSVAALSVTKHACPTCHQHLSDTLLAQTTTVEAMTVEDNIELIKHQIATYENLESSSKKAVEAMDIELNSLRLRISSLRATIRSIRQTLTSAESAPSAEAIRERVEIENRVRLLKTTETNFAAKLVDVGDAADAWKSLLADKANLPKDGLSAEDSRKLAQLEKLFREHLGGFGFESVDINTLEISPFTYRPTREGFDLGRDVSASDNVRIIWAYLHSLLELSLNFDLNHAGLLLFDEPRQQSAGRRGFKHLLAKVAAGKKNGHQVIFATSEPLSNLTEMTDGLEFELINFEGRIVRPR